MKKNILVTYIFSILFSTMLFANNYELKVDEIHCAKCVQKIHDYLTKSLKDRVQNLKIDEKANTIQFDSISVDTVELETIQKDLGAMGYKITNTVIKPDVEKKI